MAAATAALAAALVACSSPPPPPPADETPDVRVVRLMVGDATPAGHQPVPLDRTTLAATLARALEEAGLPGSPPDPLGVWAGWDGLAARLELPRRFWDVTVEARAVYGQPGEAGIAPEIGPGPLKAVWILEVTLRPPDGSPSLYAFSETTDEAEFGGDAAGAEAALMARVEAAARTAAAEIEQQVRTLRLPPEKLVVALGHAEPAVRRAAAERLGMLRHAPAVPELAARIDVEDDRDALLRMIGALAEIGDDRAAEALIARANPRDREVLRAVLDALSVVGGARVDDFLGIMALHDDADVRLMVEQARTRLERRRP